MQKKNMCNLNKIYLTQIVCLQATTKTLRSNKKSFVSVSISNIQYHSTHVIIVQWYYLDSGSTYLNNTVLFR